MKLVKRVSGSRTISTRSLKAAIFSTAFLPVHQQLHPSHQSIKLLEFADNTIVIGLISGGDESSYRWESEYLVTWYSQNNLELNVLKTVEMVVDFRKNSILSSPITLCDSPVPAVDSFSFLGSIITQDLKWELNISFITNKAQQRMFFLRQLKKFKHAKDLEGALLHGHHGVHLLLLYHRLVQCSRRHSAVSPGLVCFQDPETSSKDCCRPL
ncbi:uncharacterized protein AB9W97_009747 [Spinachia spinachia]